MKLSIMFIGILSLINTQTMVNAQSKTKKDSIRLRQSILDSLDKQAVPFAHTKEKYKKTRELWENVEANFPEEKIILSNGVEAVYRTSNNKKTQEALSKLFAISPVDFLLSLRGIKGLISIKTTRISWVKKEDIPYLLKLAQVDMVTPQLMQLDTREMPNYQPVFTPRYFEVPLAINALELIHSYLNDTFPTITPSYESIKTWYDSGKPKEEYKYEPFIPVTVTHFYKPTVKGKP